MKPLIRIAAIVTVTAVTVAAPFSAFAQSSNSPMTRGEAKAQLIQLENAGYNPTNNDPNYPRNVQAAITRVDNSEGGMADGSSAGGNVGSVANAGYPNTRLNAAVPVAPMSGPNSAYFGR